MKKACSDKYGRTKVAQKQRGSSHKRESITECSKIGNCRELRLYKQNSVKLDFHLL